MLSPIARKQQGMCKKIYNAWVVLPIGKQVPSICAKWRQFDSNNPLFWKKTAKGELLFFGHKLLRLRLWLAGTLTLSQFRTAQSLRFQGTLQVSYAIQDVFPASILTWASPYHTSQKPRINPKNTHGGYGSFSAQTDSIKRFSPARQEQAFANF